MEIGPRFPPMGSHVAAAGGGRQRQRLEIGMKSDWLGGQKDLPGWPGLANPLMEKSLRGGAQLGKCLCVRAWPSLSSNGLHSLLVWMVWIIAR
jgi:hypothetical protein